MSNKNNVIVVDEQMLQATDAIRDAITKKHKKISRIKTPKPYIKKKMGLDYFGCDLDKDYVEFMKSRMSKEEVWDKFGG